ncbi:DMT family transporter [Loktanella sp. S4079]|uniref:DMT family transporter n=1 Tax=Loktanella sp. S4079 TaxID=579483 RepID=UPI0005FA450C|nr:DMT family transporter [Loktanella sp. S4079]KJZ20307.1 multidrug transporter [Loktanella sp. S4079]
MERKDQIDTFGAIALSGFALFLAFNQVVIKVTNEGLQPVFFAGVRSAGAALCLWAYLRWRNVSLRIDRDVAIAGIIAGFFFGAQFLCLFIALDLTTVGRSGVIFYSMPVWLALIAHWVMPNDRITVIKAVGLAFAVGGVAWAMLDRSTAGDASLWGDLAALGGAMSWAIGAMVAKASPLSRARPEIQLLIQLVVSAPILLCAAVFFGPFIRELGPLHVAGLLFQIVVVVSAGFVVWLWLLSVYPASGVASFSFLSPVQSVGLGWALLGETVGLELIGALVLVAIGIILINRPVKSRKTSA